MGRVYWNKKQEADGMKQVSVAFLSKHGYFEEGWHNGKITWSRHGQETGNISIYSLLNEYEQYVRFMYTQTDRHTGEKSGYDYKVSLTTTDCYFGGRRYWFICPWYVNDEYCGRRVGVLYLGTKHFACRHCHSLTYNSRNLGGIAKSIGQTISYPELERLEGEVKRKYYAGKITRKFMRYLKKYDRSNHQMTLMLKRLGGRYI